MKVTLEQKHHAVRLARSGAPVKIVADELGVTPQAVYLWLKKYPEVNISEVHDEVYGCKPIVEPLGIFGRFKEAIKQALGFGSSV